MKSNDQNITTWTAIKDNQFGKVGTARRDELDREFESFNIGILLREARESKKMTQEVLQR